MIHALSTRMDFVDWFKIICLVATGNLKPFLERGELQLPAKQSNCKFLTIEKLNYAELEIIILVQEDAYKLKSGFFQTQCRTQSMQ